MKRTIFALSAILLLAFSTPVAAQHPPKGTSPAQAKAAAALAKQNGASEAEIRDLIKTLEDEQARRKLVAQLNAMLAVQQTEKTPEEKKSLGVRVLDLISSRLEEVSGELLSGTRAIMDLPNFYEWLVKQTSDEAERARWLEIAWKIALAISLGLLGEWVVRRMLARPRRALEARQVDSIWVKLIALLARTVIDIIPIAGFLGGSYATLTLVGPGQTTQLVALALINANVLVRVVLASARLLLSPAVPALRIVPLENDDANYLFIWTRRLADVGLYGYFLIAAFGYLGLPPSGVDMLFKILGLFVTLMLIVFILQNRTSMGDRLRGKDLETVALRVPRARLADIWHVVVILYLAAMYLTWALAVEGGFDFVLQASALTLVIVAAARLALGGMRRATQRIFRLNDDIRQRYPGLEARANRYLPIFENIVTIAVMLIALFAILEAWGIDALGWLATPLGQRVTGSAITIALMLVVTVAILELVSALIERYLSREGAQVSTRAKTLLPLLRTTVLVVLVTMFVLVTLSEFGLNIAPLLAGAGVVGLAIGFGAQTLVKDIITGMFILMEDQLSVGDVVKVGSHAGVVENLSLRTLRLRDLAGTVHVIPFSEVTTLENLTKDFSRYVFEVGVAYREDTDEVVQVLHEIGAEMQQDEVYKALILEPLEVLGVDSFGDNAVVIKARITTVPIKQWQVGREFNRRMKKRFDALGIEIPFPHRTIYFGEDKVGNAPPARVAMQDRASATERNSGTGPAPASSGSNSIAATPDTGGVGGPDSH